MAGRAYIRIYRIYAAYIQHIHSMPLYASAEDDDECGKLYGAAGAAYISCAYIRAQLCENDCQQLENTIAAGFFLPAYHFKSCVDS